MAGQCEDGAVESAWEMSKENVKPIKSGRKVECISAILKPSEVDMERLRTENKKFEEEIFTQDNLEDPLDPWDRYLKWTIQNFPKGMNEGNLQNLLKNFIGKFQHVEKYKNDPRYINAWLTLAENCTDPLETYSYMYTQGIGTKFSLFYIAWAEEFVKCGDMKKAERIFSTGDEVGAEPRDLLQQKHSEFQLVVARRLLSNNAEVDNDNGSSATDTDSHGERAVLGGLKGRGKKQVVGSQRTGRFMQGYSTINVQQAPVPSLNKKPSVSKFQVYEDIPRDHVMGETGQWSSMPPTSGEKENTKKAGPWAAAAVRPKKHSTISDQQHVVVEPSKSNFAIYRDDEDSDNNPVNRKVASNVETILHEMKASANPTTSLQTVIDRPQHDSKTISKYCVDKVYSVMGEMQLEEIRAIFWRHRKKQREEAQKNFILQWTSSTAQPDDSTKKDLENQKQQLERERQLLDEQLKMLAHEQECVKLEKEKLAKLKQVQLPFTEKESASIADSEMLMYFKSESEKAEYGKKETADDDCITLSDKPQSSGFVIFDETSQEENKKDTDQPKLKTIDQPDVSNASLNLNHSRRSQPSPTMYTKEALGEVLHWFQNPLPDEEDADMIPDMISAPAESERIILSNQVKNIEAPCPQTSVFERTEIAQPVASFPSTSSGDSGGKTESLEMKGKEDATHFFERTEYRFDDATVTSHHFAANARPASTPFYGKNKHIGADELQDAFVFASISAIHAPSSVSENRLQDNGSDVGEEVVTPLNIVTFDERLSSNEEQMQEEEIRNACSAPNQLSPIMEASNESEKSSMMSTVPPESGTGRGSASEANWPPTNCFFFEAELKKTDVGNDQLLEGFSQDVSNNYFLCDNMNFDLWPSDGTTESKQVPVSRPEDDFSRSTEASTPTVKERLESSEETNTYVDTLCGRVQRTNLNDTLPKEKEISSQINMIHDPWDEKLLNNVMKNSSVCNLATVSNLILPKIKKSSVIELGQKSYKVGSHIVDGAFAKIYEACPLDEDGKRNNIVLKIQSSPCHWELYAVKECKSRLLQAGHTSLAEAILDIASAHIFSNGSVFVLPYLAYGTLLDMVNKRKGKVIPNDVALWVALSLMRIIHGLHTIGFIHGDVKPDNFMMQFTGDNARIMAIDFGRAIDMRGLPANTAFMRRCNTSGFDCIQMKEGQPWNYHTDFYGIAGILHVILFGKYMQIQNKNGVWSLTNKLRRWYDDVTWTDFFSSLLNCQTPTKERPFTLEDSPLPRLISVTDGIMSDMNHHVTKIIDFFSPNR